LTGRAASIIFATGESVVIRKITVLKDHAESYGYEQVGDSWCASRMTAMTQDFLAAVETIVQPLLTQLGFQLDQYDGDVDEGGPKGSLVFFRSKDCKIQIYDSVRGGEVNCMIAPLEAANVFGPYDRSKKWQYLPRYAVWQGVPLEEVMKDKLSVDFRPQVKVLSRCVAASRSTTQ
jgi:hypothetical protein